MPHGGQMTIYDYPELFEQRSGELTGSALASEDAPSTAPNSPDDLPKEPVGVQADSAPADATAEPPNAPTGANEGGAKAVTSAPPIAAASIPTKKGISQK